VLRRGVQRKLHWLHIGWKTTYGPICSN